MPKVRLHSELTLYPCPVVLVTCQAAEDRINVVTVSWAGIACSSPEIVTISLKPSRYSYSIIKKTREFVINIPTAKHVREVDICGTVSGRDTDKLELCGFTLNASDVVTTPGIKECPVQLECKVQQVLNLGGHHLFVSRVVCKSIDPGYCITAGHHSPVLLDPIVYLRPDYFRLNDEVIGSYGFTSKR